MAVLGVSVRILCRRLCHRMHVRLRTACTICVCESQDFKNNLIYSGHWLWSRLLQRHNFPVCETSARFPLSYPGDAESVL